MTGVRALASAAAVACGSLEAEDDPPALPEGGFADGGNADAATDASATGSPPCPTLFEEPFALGFSPAREPWDQDDVEGILSAVAAPDAPSPPNVLAASTEDGGAVLVRRERDGAG